MKNFNKKHKIVFIEDESEILELYARKFRENNYNVLTAANGKDGYKMILEYKPDFIITDIIMPEKDGFYVIEKTKNNPETKSIPIIVLTNLENGTDKEEILKLGAAAYYTKVKYTPLEFFKEIKSFFNDNFEKLSFAI